MDRRYYNVLLLRPLHLKVVSIAGALFSAEASMCYREAGEKETEGARGPIARFLFFYYCYFYWDTQRQSLRRRQSREDRSGLIYLRSLYFDSQAILCGFGANNEEREFFQRKRLLRRLCPSPLESCQVA